MNVCIRGECQTTIVDILRDEDQLPDLPPLSGEFVGVTRRDGATLLLALLALLGSVKSKSLSCIILETPIDGQESNYRISSANLSNEPKLLLTLLYPGDEELYLHGINDLLARLLFAIRSRKRCL